MRDTTLNYEKFLVLAKARLVSYFESHKLAETCSIQDLYLSLFDSIKLPKSNLNSDKGLEEDITKSISVLYEQSNKIRIDNSNTHKFYL